MGLALLVTIGLNYPVEVVLFDQLEATGQLDVKNCSLIGISIDIDV